MKQIFYSSKLPRWYNAELAKYPDNLTRDEEIDLGNKIKHLEKSGKFWTQEYKNTVNELFLPKRNFAAGYVIKVPAFHAPFLDRVNYALFGMSKAVMAFNPEFGDCIDAYSTTFIRNEVRVCEYNYRTGLAASRETFRLAGKFKKTKEKEEKSSTKISLEEIVEIYNKENKKKKSFQPITTAIAENYLELLRVKEISPSQIRSDKEETIETLQTPGLISEQEERDFIKGMIEEIQFLRGTVLDKVEKGVIQGRYGSKVLTLKVLSNIYGKTGEGIRQIEIRALGKLKKAFENQQRIYG